MADAFLKLRGFDSEGGETVAGDDAAAGIERLERHDGCGVALFEGGIFRVYAVERAVGFKFAAEVPREVVVAENVGDSDFEKRVHRPVAEGGGGDTREVFGEGFLLAEPCGADIEGGVVESGVVAHGHLAAGGERQRACSGFAGKVGGDGFLVFRDYGLRGDVGRELSREEGESRCGGRESSYVSIFHFPKILCFNRFNDLRIIVLRRDFRRRDGVLFVCTTENLPVGDGHY